MAKVTKTDDEWRSQLGLDAFEITRRAGTERAFTGEYWDTKAPGVYNCRVADVREGHCVWFV